MLDEHIAQEVFPLFQAALMHDLTKHNGYLCQEEEGTFMVVFSTLENAAAFSTEFHVSLQACRWPESLSQTPASGGLEARIGLFSGVPVEKRPHDTSGRADYFGPVLNRAARMAYAAHSGRTLIPHYLAERFGAEQQEKYVLQEVGQHAFKGIDTLFDVDDIALSQTQAPPILSTVTLEKYNAILLEAMKDGSPS